MIALAADLLFALAALVAVVTLADNAVKARRAYAGLMREKALMEAGIALHAGPRTVRLRPAATRRGSVTPLRRAPLTMPAPVPARAAA